MIFDLCGLIETRCLFLGFWSFGKGWEIEFRILSGSLLGGFNKLFILSIRWNSFRLLNYFISALIVFI